MKKTFIAAALLATTAASNAQDTTLDRQGWFVGGAIGSIDLDFTPEHRSQDSFDINTNVYTAFGGFNFTDWFGIEFDLSLTNEFTDTNTKADASISGTSFSPKFTYHINEVVGVYFKAGLQFVAYSQTYNEPFYNTSYSYTKTWGGLAPLLGTGIQFSSPVGVITRLDYRYSSLDMERTDDLGISNIDDMKLTQKMLNLSVHYQF